MSTADRIIRLIIAAIIVILFFTHVLTGAWAIILMIVAGIFVLTSLISSCPVYALFGFSSCPVKKPDA